MDDGMKTERVHFLMSVEDLAKVDDWAYARRLKSRGEAIRRLLEIGLDASERGK